AAGLDQPARVTDEGEADLAAIDLLGRMVGMGTWNPFWPGRSFALATELPAQHRAERLRRHAIGVEELPAVEMVRWRPGIGSAVVAAHFPARLAPKRGRSEGISSPARPFKMQTMRLVSLTFQPCGGLRPQPSRKGFLFDPPTGPVR